MATVSETDFESQTSAGATVWTFTAQAIGANASNHILYFGLASRAVGALNNASTLTVDGVAATSRVQQVIGTGTSNNAAIFSLERSSLPDPTQTDVDVVWTINTNSVRAGCATWVGVSSVAAATDTGNDGDAGNVGSGTILNPDTDVPASGIAVGVGHWGGTSTATWTGLTEVTDALSTGGGAQFTTALISNAAGSTPLAISVTKSGAGDDQVVVVASFAAAAATGSVSLIGGPTGSNLLIGLMR